MGKYSIKELEKLSGIKAHTLRIWEKRYGIISPERTDTNIRRYTDEQLKKLLNIAILNHNGYKISKIAELAPHEVTEKVTELSEKEHPDDLSVYIDQLSMAMIDMDEAKFEKLLSSYILRFGFERTVVQILYPFLEKIGILWLSNNITPVQEHFMSNLIRQKIIVAIDGLSTTTDDQAKQIILFLPENELHEIGLLFYYYITKSLNLKTFYLGQNVPLKDLEKVAQSINPDYLLTVITHLPQNVEVEELITQLSDKFPNCQLLMSGRPIIEFEEPIPKNVVKFKKAEDLKQILK
ncbi:MAG: MerR family transcriptional regulator [Fulvivirga sp.]|nr:MerR family transcriptional regulator [Fulvivirga sp.]